MSWGFVGSAAVSLVSSQQAGSAARSAARTQAEAAEAGITEEQRQFNVTQQQYEPYRQAGLSALQQQQALLGLGYVDPKYQQAINDLRSNISAMRASREAEAPTLDRQYAIFDSGGGERVQQLDAQIAEAESQLAVAEQAATSAATTAPSAAEQQRTAFAAFTESPGQQFLRAQQERALLRNTAAIGGLGGGNVRTALQEQAFGRAQTDYGNYYNRLAGLSSTGQAATGSTAQYGSGASANIANLRAAGGEARASGILGQQQAQSQGVSNVFGALGQSGIFNQPAQTQPTQWGTTQGSQQSNMLAEQQAGFY